MSRTSFRVNLHSVVARMSRNSFPETGAISEVYVTATGFEPTTHTCLCARIPLLSLKLEMSYFPIHENKSIHGSSCKSCKLETSYFVTLSFFCFF